MAQVNHAIPLPIVFPDTNILLQKHKRYISNVNDQLDLIDVGIELFNKNAAKRIEADTDQPGKLRISAVPAAGYTLQTGFAIIGVANAAFYTSKVENEKVSSVLTNITYSQYKQIIFPVQTNIWTTKNKFNIVTDWRYLKFPSLTYGLGGYTKLSDGYTIDYSAVRLHQAILKELTANIYAGIGYNFDYYWNVSEINPPANKITDFEAYGLSSSETASGITLNFLFDNRRNSINPQNGEFLNVIYRTNLNILGNSENWRSLIIDGRKYVRLPNGSDNILAFWTYDWFTIDGNPPYLLLPSTGGDPSSNTGRGYIQGRFRGKNMLYAETEYRFHITNNGLLGGVVFLNVQSFTEQASGRFETLYPGYGTGIRLKLNKFSRTNVSIDYGLGIDGSKGFFVNLGEIF